MFAVAFDLVVADTRKHHPVGVTAAYREIGDVLAKYGFIWTQGSLYLLKNKDLTQLFKALNALKALPWFPPSVRDIRAFRVEEWSDFTATIKEDTELPPRKPQ